jgi:anti-anti-sigma regulatory factor
VEDRACSNKLVVTPTSAPGGFSVTGVIDQFNVAQFEAWLRSVLHRRGQTARGDDTHLDVARLEFPDESGIQALVGAARALNGYGRLVLHGLPYRLGSAMRAVGWNELPSLLIADRSTIDS